MAEALAATNRERAGEAIRYHGELPSRFFDDPLAYADGLRAR